MIKSTELRIGNWVYEDGKPERVIMVDGEVNVIQCENGINTPLSDFEPIKLTEQILLKAGFKKHGKVVSYLSLNTGLSDGYDDVEALLNWSDFTEKNEGELLFVFEGKGRWINISHIKYLHQLQNLFHALTNTELTINL